MNAQRNERQGQRGTRSACQGRGNETTKSQSHNMASFLIHADAVATDRESTPVELSNVKVIDDDGTRFVRYRLYAQAEWVW